ncbi:hypothetical protein IGI04_033375 [Brassica rapa subsp. trilocularis]|uniref:Uncharacterized protein n=1 Tax=Brassica rapa subsp. trilocularis TaxID=1813537 RepID=A0ABQ7L7T0_BRACM|nr:hypothetical protein IGI04_033375 [Brassica rapa subsp. trilocularis]
MAMKPNQQWPLTVLKLKRHELYPLQEVIVKAVTTDPNTGLKVPFSKLFASSTMDKIKRLSYVPAALSLKHAPSTKAGVIKMKNKLA